MSRYKGQLLGGKRARGTIHHIALKAFTMTMGDGECFFQIGFSGKKFSKFVLWKDSLPQFLFAAPSLPAVRLCCEPVERALGPCQVVVAVPSPSEVLPHFVLPCALDHELEMDKRCPAAVV